MTNALNEQEFISKHWGEDILMVIDKQETSPMTMKDFLSHCTACGGNWGGMLLTGIKELWPAVWDAIPDNMGHHSFICLCITLTLLGVEQD